MSIKLSAIVVIYNDAAHLRECLQNLYLCDQLLIINIGSSDGSDKITREFTNDIYTHEYSPGVELVLPGKSFADNGSVP